jgi:hypothetical protein
MTTMNENEERLAKQIYGAIQESMHQSDRSQQAQQFRVGVSDLGYCSERLRRFLAKETPDETDMLAAFIGTWIGEGVEHAVIKHLWPDAIIQEDIMVSLVGDQGTYLIPGHPDIISPSENVLIDVKTANGLEFPKRHGFEDVQKKFQRHLYGKAAIEKGWLTEDAQVGNLWLDRSASNKEPYLRLEPYDPQVVEEATQWLDGVIYAWSNNETAAKEPPRELCTACGFYQDCRVLDTDVEGLLKAPEVLTAVEIYDEALGMERAAKKMKAEVKDLLDGISGSTGTHLVRWVHVGPAEVAYTRGGYEKMSITKLKEAK